MKTPELPKLSLSQAFSTKRSATAQKSNAMSNTTNQTSKTERSRVSKFIKNISDFFKTLFKQPSSTNAPSMPNMTNIPISIVSVSTPAVDKALESKQAIISTLQTVFETPSLASNTEIKSFKSEFEAQDFSELTLKESQLFMDKVQQVVAKDSEDKQAIISTLQTVFETPAFASNTEIKSLKSAFEAKDFSELTLKETQLFMSTVKQVVVKQAKLTVETSKQSIQSLIIHFVKSTHSKFQESIAPIQKTVMKRIRTIQATRDLESKFFKDTTGSQVSTEKGKENYQKLLNLYTEKHLKTTFTTIMGTQYSHLNADTKDVQLGGRQSSQIDADIEDLLLNNPKLKAQYDKQIGGLFTGLSSILKKETETLIKTTLANDQTMANIKALQVSIIAIQETTEGLDQANSQCGGSDDTALNQTFHSAKELMTISTNFSHFCQNFIEGFHSKTHIDKTSIKSIVQAIADSDQKFQAIPASKKDAYITALTEHLNHRLEHKKVIQKTSQSMGSIDTSKLATFKLKSAKPSTQKTWHKLFSQKNKFLITKSKGEHMELFNKI